MRSFRSTAIDFLLFAPLLVGGCSISSPATPTPTCAVTNEDGGGVIQCTDGTTVTFANGAPGPAGPAGEGDGGPVTCTVMETDGGGVIQCTDGTSVSFGNGATGAAGATGA